MSFHFTTASGAHYEVQTEDSAFPGAPPLEYIRRLAGADTPEKRADGEWVRLYSHSPVVEGVGVLLEISSLAEYGPDDVGQHDTLASWTTRATTPIVRIWEENE